MHRGCVSNFPISVKIARERSAWSPIDSNSDELLRLWWVTDFGSVSANAAESTTAEQPIDTIKKNERTNIAASPQISKVSATRANCSALPKQKFCSTSPLDVIASFYANNAGWQLLEERQDRAALQLAADDPLASGINSVNLEDRLGDVETDCRDRLHGSLL
jgi:hypothetical protein